MAEGDITRLDIKSGRHNLDNEAIVIEMLRDAVAPGPGPWVDISGFDFRVDLLGTFVGTVVVEHTPNGTDIITAFSTTTVPNTVDRSDVKFPAKIIRLNVTAFTSGSVSGMLYGERRK